MKWMFDCVVQMFNQLQADAEKLQTGKHFWRFPCFICDQIQGSTQMYSIEMGLLAESTVPLYKWCHHFYDLVQVNSSPERP